MSFLWLISSLLITHAEAKLPVPKRLQLGFEPNVVTLTGKVETQTFPGRPGYASIAEGDEMERHRYLRLTNAIDVIAQADESDLNSETELNVQIMQIVIKEDADWKTLQAGRTCTLTGTLFHQHTGHHHSRVLIEPSAIRCDVNS